MEKEESKEIYKERKVIVEPVFGQIKNTGFRGFSVRGKEKVAGEFSLVCATHNIKKMGSDHITQFRVTVLFMVGTTSAPRTSSKTQRLC
jgi:hypothetical protein